MYNVLDRGVNMKEYTKNQVHEVACAFNEHKIIALLQLQYMELE